MDFRAEVRFAIRSFLKRPSFFWIVILTLALGIGMNSAMFGIFETVILRPLPYKDSDRLVLLWQTRPGGQRNSVSLRNYFEWEKEAHSFQDIAALAGAIFNVTGAGDPIQVQAARVTPNFLRCLGVQPVLGRLFDTSDVAGSSPPVVVVGYDLWQAKFGGNRSILGRVVNLNGIPHTIIGVFPPADPVFKAMELWAPTLISSQPLDTYNLLVMARLRSGVTLVRAGSELQTIAKRLASALPQTNQGWGTMVVSFQEALVGDMRPALLAFLAAVASVLLIACANVANLLLARASSRQKEIAIRAAIGAGHRQLMRQLLTESIILALAGGAAGLFVAAVAMRLAAKFSVGNLPRLESVSINIPVLLFTFVLACITGVLFGSLPARHLLRSDLNAALRESAHSIGALGAKRSQTLLATAEVALALILLISAGLTFKSFIRLQNIDRGFSPSNLLTFRIAVPPSRYHSNTGVRQFYERTFDRLQSLPGVEAVGATTNLPLDGLHIMGMYFSPEGAAPVPNSKRPVATTNVVNNGYFPTLGLALLAGRRFNERDQETSLPVAIVSESLAHRFFPDGKAVGRRIMLDAPGGGRPVQREVVGIVRDIRYPTKDAENSWEIYVPFSQYPWRNFFIVIRCRIDPTSIVPQVRSALAEVDPEQPAADLHTMQDRISSISQASRWNSALAGAFAVVALALACIGVYGVITYIAAQRTETIGVRIAVGAQPSHITFWILRDAFVIVGIGVILGLICYFGSSRLLQSMLYGISPLDRGTISTATGLIGTVGILASYLPARRAARIDPMIVLRSG